MDPTPPEVDDAPAGKGGVVSFVGRLRPWLSGHAAAVVLGGLALLTYTLLDVVPAFVYRALYDEAIPARDVDRLLWLFGALAAAIVGQGLMAAGRALIFGRLAARVGVALRRALLDRVQTVHLADPRISRRAQVIALFGADVDAIENALLIELPRACQGLLGALIGTATLLIIDWRLTLMMVLAAPVSGVGSWLLSGRAQQAQAARSAEKDALQSSLDDIVRGQRTIRAFGLTTAWAERFGERLLRYRDRAARAGSLTIGLQSATTMATLVVTLLVLAGATAMVFADWLSIGGLIGFLSVLFTAIGGVITMAESTAGLLTASDALRRIERLLDAEPRRDGAIEAPPLSDALSLEGLRLTFDDVRWVLDGLDLRVEKGQSVALVGPSGAGKSTVLGVLLGFEEPRHGRVLWDGHDVTRLSRASLRGRMAVVFQETELFALSVADNIRVGRPDASADDVRAAARAAELHGVIAALPQGYDTLLGDGGHTLSGGQRQRLAIARAVLREPEVLLLDEATSALDPRTEAEINATLARLSAGHTVISVTHRLASVVDCDRIFVLDGGAVVEAGTHAELLARDGLYADLHRRQHAVRIEHGAPRVDPGFLASVPLFADLDPAVHARLVQAFVAERRQAGEVVIRAGEPGEHLYVVVRGELIVEAPSPAGPRRMGVLRDGDYFGEVALLVDMPRSATVTARHETVLLGLARAAFLDLLDAHPEARARVTAEAERRLASVRAITGPAG